MRCRYLMGEVICSHSIINFLPLIFYSFPPQALSFHEREARLCKFSHTELSLIYSGPFPEHSVRHWGQHQATDNYRWEERKGCVMWTSRSPYHFLPYTLAIKGHILHLLRQRRDDDASPELPFHWYFLDAPGPASLPAVPFIWSFTQFSYLVFPTWA